MSKNIELDKFYTPTQTAEKCVELMLNTITNRMFVTEYLEPSAGKEKRFDTHTQTYKIVVEDKSKVEEVKNTILSFDWSGYKKHQSAPSLSKNDIYRLFKTF